MKRIFGFSFSLSFWRSSARSRWSGCGLVNRAKGGVWVSRRSFRGTVRIWLPRRQQVCTPIWIRSCFLAIKHIFLVGNTNTWNHFSSKFFMFLNVREIALELVVSQLIRQLLTGYHFSILFSVRTFQVGIFVNLYLSHLITTNKPVTSHLWGARNTKQDGKERMAGCCCAYAGNGQLALSHTPFFEPFIRCPQSGMSI